MDFPNIDPVIFQIGPLALRWYSLAYIVGILGGLYYILFLLRQTRLWGAQSGVGAAPDENHYHDFIVWAVIGVIIGGRLGEVIFYHPAYFFNNPAKILAVWEGGMSFHGGMLGAFAAGYFFTRARRLSLLTFCDSWCSVVPIGLFLGRIANFINGELWGRPSDVPWAVIFPRGGPIARHPSQLYEALLEGMLLFAVLQVAVFYFHALKRPGLVMGLFFTGYGAMRIVGEFFRNPDGYIIGELTLGMGLSLPMIAFGLMLLRYVHSQQSA